MDFVTIRGSKVVYKSMRGCQVGSHGSQFTLFYPGISKEVSFNTGSGLNVIMLTVHNCEIVVILLRVTSSSLSTQKRADIFIKKGAGFSSKEQ